MIRRKRSVGRSARQLCLAPSGIDDVPVRPVSLENSPDIADVVHEACDDEVGIIAGMRGNEKRTSFHDLVPGQRHQLPMHSSASRAKDGTSSLRRACEDPKLRSMSAARNEANASAVNFGTVIMAATAGSDARSGAPSLIARMP